MKINCKLLGSKENWLNSNKYVVTDIFDEQFAVNFDQIPMKERIALGGEVSDAELFDEIGSFLEK